jgi:hydroquinone glucosyltransferase
VSARCLFMPMNLHMLSLVVHLSELAASLPGEFGDLAEPVRLPGCVPILGLDIVSSLQDRFDPSYVVMLHLVVHCREAAEAILVNSFDAIKPEAVEVLRHPAKSGGPPVYPIDPDPLGRAQRRRQRRCPFPPTRRSGASGAR